MIQEPFRQRDPMSAFTAPRAPPRPRESAGLAQLHALLAALWLLTSLPAMAATGTRWIPHADAVFTRITTPDLRDANALAQDGQGLMWIGTQAGLARWDGYRLRSYASDPQNPAALHDNFIQALQTDVHGRLWIGTVAGGLARYDPEHDSFVNVDGPRNGPTSRHVWTIGAAVDGGLWIGTSAGLDHLDVNSGVRNHVPIGRSAALAVKAVVEGPEGELWVGTDEGLLRRAPGATAFVGVPLGAIPGDEPRVVQLIRDGGGRLWIGTDANGAFSVEPGGSKAHRVRETTAASRLASENIRTIAEVAPGEVWLGTGGGGIVVVDTHNGGATRRMRNHLALPNSLADDDISLIFRDRSGVIWVATTMAVNVHDGRDHGIQTLFGSTTGNRPITSPQVPAVMVAPDGRAWLSLGTIGGVDILDPVAGRVGQLRPDPSRPLTALPKARVLAMAVTPTGEVFIGTRRGLYRADAHGRAVARIDVPTRAADAAVWSVAVDAGVLWFGGPDGLWAIDPKRHGRARLLRHESAERIGGPIVTALLRGKGTTLWVGTSVGVSRVDVNTDVVERLVSDATDPTALPGNYVASLLLDARDRLWVASLSAGLQVLERRDADGRARFRRIGVREGLPHSGVDSLLTDSQGRIWVSTDGGLAVIDPETYAIRAFGAADGVALQTYWTNAGARTAAGELLFGGQGGLTVVWPEHVPSSGTSPPLVVTGLRAGGSMLVASRFNATTRGARPRIDIAAREPNLSVEFSALDYAWPELNRYGYRLVGFDRDWTEADAGHRVAAYTNLPPGDYTLQLRGTGPAAQATATALELPIRVLPAWYQTMTFRVAAGAGALMLVALLVHARTRVLRHRQRELRAQVALRTSELQESQRQLELIAYTDPLTGLENRRRFNENLHQSIALALRSQSGVTLLLIDLDHFKTINDTLGHDAGDALLIEVSRRLLATARASDHVARLGGDEFAVVLVGTGAPDEVNASCGRILQSLMLPFAYRERSLRAGASIGAASFPQHAIDVESLYKRADVALYAAKNGGRNTWCLSEPDAGPVIAVPFASPNEAAG